MSFLDIFTILPLKRPRGISQNVSGLYYLRRCPGYKIYMFVKLFYLGRAKVFSSIATDFGPSTNSLILSSPPLPHSHSPRIPHKNYFKFGFIVKTIHLLQPQPLTLPPPPPPKKKKKKKKKIFFLFSIWILSKKITYCNSPLPPPNTHTHTHTQTHTHTHTKYYLTPNPPTHPPPPPPKKKKKKKRFFFIFDLDS